MVQLQVRITAASGRTNSLIDAFQSVARGAHRERACLARLTTDVNDGSILWYWEEWPTLGEFETCLRSDRFGRVLALLDTAADSPLLECRFISETRGPEYVAAIRGIAPHAGPPFQDSPATRVDPRK